MLFRTSVSNREIVWFGFMTHQPFFVVFCQILFLLTHTHIHTHTHTHTHIYIYDLKTHFVDTDWNDKNSSFSKYSVYHKSKIEWFQVLMCIINSSFKHQFFFCFTIKWSNSFISNNSIYVKSFVSQFKCLNVLFDPYIGPHQLLPIQAWVDLDVMAMKVYSTYPEISSSTRTSPSDYLMSYQDNRWVWVLSLCRYAIALVWTPSRLSCNQE